MWDDEAQASAGTDAFSLGDEAGNMWNDVKRTVGKVQNTVTPWIDGVIRTVGDGARDLWGGVAE